MSDNQKWEDIINLTIKCLNKITDKEAKSILFGLNEIFRKGFLINYSLSYQLAVTLCNKNKNDDNAILFSNIQRLAKLANEKKFASYDNNVRKFIDYWHLETSRYLQINSKTEKDEYLFNEMQQQLENAFENLSFVTNNIESLDKKVERAAGNSVANIGVIAGMAFVFTGGLSILGSAFSAMESNISKYRIIFMLAVAGLIIFNIIFALLFAISRINSKDIGVVCKRGYRCYCCDCRGSKGAINNLACQIINKYPYALLFNVFLVYLMYIVFVLWAFSPNNSDIFISTIQFILSLPLGWLVQLSLLAAPALMFWLITLRITGTRKTAQKGESEFIAD